MTDVSTRESSSDSSPPPGAGYVLVDWQPYGQLVVQEHTYTEGTFRQGTPARRLFETGETKGEQITLTARVAPSATVRRVTAQGGEVRVGTRTPL